MELGDLMAEEELPEIEPNLTKEELAFANMMASEIEGDPQWIFLYRRMSQSIHEAFIYLHKHGLGEMDEFNLHDTGAIDPKTGMPERIYQVRKFWLVNKPKGFD
jgi:hypothetical protein